MTTGQRLTLVVFLAVLILLAVVSFSFAQTPPTPPPVTHTDLLGTPPGAELVPAPMPKKKKSHKKHKSGYEKIAETPIY